MPIPLLIPAIVAAIGGISSIIQQAQQNRAVKKTNQANANLAKYQLDENQKQIDAQNLYNSPSMQMKRYGDAGLNPHLIYGQGNSGNQAGIATYQRPEVQTPPPVSADIPSMISQFQQVQLQQAQIKSINASTESTEQKTWNDRIKSMILNLDANSRDFELNRKKTLAPYQLTVQQNKAAASETDLPTAVQRLQNMTEDQKLKLLGQKYGQGALTTQGLQQEKLRLENVFNTFRNQFKEMGVESSDNFWVRFFSRMLQESDVDIFSPVQDGFKKLKEAKRPGTYIK